MQPEESAKTALSAARHLCHTQQYEEQRIQIAKGFAGATVKAMAANELSMTMSALALSDTLVMTLSRSIVVIAQSLLLCPMLDDKDEAYKDLFRRAVIDYLLDGTSVALKMASMNALLEVDEFMSKED